MRRKVLLCGYYGYSNVGDDALVCVCIENLWKRLGTDIKIGVISKTPVFYEKGANAYYPELNRRFSRTRAVVNADVIIYGGGGVFQDYRSTGLVDLQEKYRQVSIAKWLRKKVAFIGISVAPLITEKGRVLARRVLNRADYVSVRDDISYSYLKSELKITAPLEKTFDLAVLLNGLPTNEYRPDSRVLGVSLLPVRDSSLFKDEEQLLTNISKALFKVITQYDFKVKLIVFNGLSGDEILARRVRKLINIPSSVSIIPYSPNPRKILTEVKDCSHFIGMRLHAAIFAYMAQIPFLIINYHTKCEGFAKKVGLDESAIIKSEDEREISGKIYNLVQNCIVQTSYPLDSARNEAAKSFENAILQLI